MGYLVTFYFIAMDFFTGLLKAFATEYEDEGDYLRDGGYPFTSKILCVIVPD